MLLVYISLSDNVRNFVKKTGFDSLDITDLPKNTRIDRDCIILLPSYVENDPNMRTVTTVTDDTSVFIETGNNRDFIKGFASSGNRNFAGDEYFMVNAKELSPVYNIPILFGFEYAGTSKDVEDFNNLIYEKFGKKPKNEVVNKPSDVVEKFRSKLAVLESKR